MIMKISTYIFSIILTTLLLFNSTRVSLTYAYYNLDPDGFVENLCINKEKPELQCNGKCHLKKVVQSEDKNQNKPVSIIDFKELPLFSNTLKFENFITTTSLKTQINSLYQNLYSFHITKDCFHPPRV